MTRDSFPEIVPAFEVPSEDSNQLLYGEVSRNLMRQLLPDEVFASSSTRDQKESFEELLPFIRKTAPSAAPTDISFYALLRYRSGAFKFFYEMLTNWLVPGKQLNVVLLLAHDFRLPTISNSIYSLCEVIIRVESEEELEEVERNYPTICTELRLGMESKYQGRRILEIRGLAADVKTAMIHEHIADIIKRMPDAVDVEVLREMQHVLVMCNDHFKASHNSRHLSRLIVTQYLFRKGAQQVLAESPDKRHVVVKIYRTHIDEEGSRRPVLGISVGITLIQDQEVVDERMFLNAIQTFLPHAQVVPQSFLLSHRGSEPYATLYIEVEQANEKRFTSQEIATLRRELPAELKTQIGCMIHPIFMPQNEEEVMRNILSLGAQMKFIRDLPQAYISFAEQTQTGLLFTVILVRVICPGSLSVHDLFNRTDTDLEYIHDRCKSLGLLRKKYAKEATVFRVKFLKEGFIRRDMTIDLHKARQYLVSELVKVIGDFRDFNGGMISKQGELLDEVKALVCGSVYYSEVFLENFFFSLTPVVMRTILPANVVAEFYNLLMFGVRSQESNAQFLESEEYLYAFVRSPTKELGEEIARVLGDLEIGRMEEARSYVPAGDDHFFGYLYRSDDPQKRALYRKSLEGIVCSLYVPA